ncbi:bola protein, partial [Pelagophyceae sp. CCMP2097]
IAAKLRAALGATHVEVVDESDGCGAKLKIVVVAAQFEGLALLAQHRLVNAAAKDELAAVHAFNLKTFSPTKW